MLHGHAPDAHHRKPCRHMWTVPTRAILADASSSSSSANSFSKVSAFLSFSFIFSFYG
jgi:hypothetical protein